MLTHTHTHTHTNTHTFGLCYCEKPCPTTVYPDLPHLALM